MLFYSIWEYSAFRQEGVKIKKVVESVMHPLASQIPIMQGLDLAVEEWEWVITWFNVEEAVLL